MQATRIALRALPLAVLALLAVSMMQSPLRVAPDVGLYVETGDLMLEGKRPYVDFIELNPPLIIYLHTLPALLARVSGVHPIAAFNAVVFLLIAWSTWAARRQLEAAQLDAFELTPDLVASAWAGLSVVLWLTAPWEVNDFAQREHLFVLAWLPYALLRCRRTAAAEISRRTAIVLGTAAGIGACIKPYFLCLALAAELALAMRRRSLRSLRAPETIALLAVAVLYAAHFALLPGEIREAFFGRWLPFVMRYYSVYALPDARSIRPDLVALLAVGLAAVAMSSLSRRSDSSLARVYASLGIFTAAGVGIYYWQGKGFFYHQIPAIAGAAVLAGVAFSQALAAAFSRLPSPRRAVFAAAAVAALGWLMLAFAAPSVAAGRNTGNPYLAAFERLTHAYCEEGEPIIVLGISVWPGYPTLPQLGRRQASRYLGLGYMILALAARDAGDGRSEEMLLGDLADDLRTRRPPVIFIMNEGCRRCAGGKLSGELLANPAMAAVLADYRTRPSLGLPRGGTLWVRADRADRDSGNVPWILPRSP